MPPPLLPPSPPPKTRAILSIFRTLARLHNAARTLGSFSLLFYFILFFLQSFKFIYTHAEGKQIVAECRPIYIHITYTESYASSV